MGSLFTLKAEKVDKSSLRTSIGLRKYICSQFKPNVAKLIYDFYRKNFVIKQTKLYWILVWVGVIDCVVSLQALQKNILDLIHEQKIILYTINKQIL